MKKEILDEVNAVARGIAKQLKHCDENIGFTALTGLLVTLQQAVGYKKELFMEYISRTWDQYAEDNKE